VAAPAQRHGVVDALRLEPPLRHGEVDEHVGGEQSLRRGAGLQERDELVGQLPGRVLGADLHGAHRVPPAWLMLAATTAVVSRSFSVGLKSTVSVPATTTGTCPGGA
jgi:hypothetical protein